MNTDMKPTPSQQSPDRANGVPPAVRLLALAIVGVVAAGLAFYGFAFTAIVFIGCFFECTGSNPLAGSAMALIPAVAVGTWVSMLPWERGRPRPSMRWFLRTAGTIWLFEVVVLSIAVIGG